MFIKFQPKTPCIGINNSCRHVGSKLRRGLVQGRDLGGAAQRRGLWLGRSDERGVRADVGGNGRVREESDQHAQLGRQQRSGLNVLVLRNCICYENLKYI